MKSVLVLTTVLIVGTSSVSLAQDPGYQFEYHEKELSDVTGPFVKKHFLGDGIANQMQLLRESYTYKVEDEIKNIENTFVDKPSIYYSVGKVNKYVKKQLKSENFTKKEAEEILGKVLTITLNIRYQDTEELEEELWKMKDPKEIADLYTNRIELGI